MAPYVRGRDRYVAKWQSRTGAEAARCFYRFRAIFSTAFGIGMILLIVMTVAGMAHITSIGYAAAALIFAVAVPLIAYSGIPLIRAIRLVKGKYGITDMRSAPLPLTAFAREGQFDAWVFTNRLDERK